LGSLDPNSGHAAVSEYGIGGQGQGFSLRILEGHVGGHAGPERMVFIGNSHPDHVDAVVGIDLGIDEGDFSGNGFAGQIGELYVDVSFRIELGELSGIDLGFDPYVGEIGDVA